MLGFLLFLLIIAVAWIVILNSWPEKHRDANDPHVRDESTRWF
jgi:hypothetical protein